MTEPLNPEVVAAIDIAEKHLPNGTAEQQKALALDIVQAFIHLVGEIARDVIRDAFSKANKNG